jgi:hypothetical protein
MATRFVEIPIEKEIVVNYCYKNTSNDIVWVKNMKPAEILGVLQWTSFSNTCPVLAVASKL